MSLLDALGGATDFLRGAATQVLDVAGAVADAKFGWQTKSLEVKQRNAELQSQANQINLQNKFAETQLEIGKLQAESALKNAQQGYFGIDSFNADNINTALANLATRVSGASGASPVMLWLTVAGVALTAMTYFNGKKS